MLAEIRGIALALTFGPATGCGVTTELPPTPAPRSPAPANAPSPAERGWLKGQLHLHSNASGDSETPPADVVRWYAARGYDFIVFTDHNRITEIAGTEHMLVMPGIELTANLDTCEPAPEPGLACLLHVNGLFVDPSRADAIRDVPLPQGAQRFEHYRHAVAVAEALGGLPMLNHPNFHYAADAALVGRLAADGLGLLEVRNEAIDSNNAGDDSHPSTEELWDDVSSAGHRVWAVATDDAHHYDDAESVRARGEIAHTGDRGFVMVRASKDPASIRAAIARGDFYASSGLTFSRLDVTADAVDVEVAGDPTGVEIVASTEHGRVVQRIRGATMRVELRDVSGAYVRLTATDAAGAKAWTQPVFR